MSQTISPSPSCGEKPSVCQAFSMSAMRGARAGSPWTVSRHSRAARTASARTTSDGFTARPKPRFTISPIGRLRSAKRTPRTTSCGCTKSRGGVVRKEDLLAGEEGLEGVDGEARGPGARPGRGEDAQDHEGEAGREERLLLGGLREEVAVLARLDRLVLACAQVRLASRAVERRVREVDDDADAGLAGGLDERAEARRRRAGGASR